MKSAAYEIRGTSRTVGQMSQGVILSVTARRNNHNILKTYLLDLGVEGIHRYALSHKQRLSATWPLCMHTHHINRTKDILIQGCLIWLNALVECTAQTCRQQNFMLEA